MFGFTFDRISIFVNYDSNLLFLDKPSNWFNQSNDFDHVYFGRLGYVHFSFILDNSLWCTPLFAFLEKGRGIKRAVVDDENFLNFHFIEWDRCKLSYLLLLKVCSDFGHCCA